MTVIVCTAVTYHNAAMVSLAALKHAQRALDWLLEQ